MNKINDYKIGEVTLPVYMCKKCGYQWIARDNEELPATCANTECRSPNWYKDRKDGKIVKPRKGI